MDLLDSRNKIDAIDKEIIRLIKERMGESAAIAEYKKMVGKKVFDPVREEEKLKAIAAMVEGEGYGNAVVDLYRQIMSISRKLQYKRLETGGHDFGFRLVDTLPFHAGTRVAFFGEEGTYTQQAMKGVFGDGVDGRQSPTFQAVMEAVSKREVDYGVLPLENSSTGGISDIYDLFMEYDNYIVAEKVLKIDHALLGLPGTRLEDVRTVYSHAQGLRQCAGLFRAHPQMSPVECVSTAGGAKKVWEDGDATQAAIASVEAAERYHLVPLAHDVNEEAANQTRFIVIANEPIFVKGAGKIALCFELPHESGSLHHVLSHFTYNGLNLTKIESRPIPGKNWEYRFFLDVEGGLMDAGPRNTCISVAEESVRFKILGNYACLGGDGDGDASGTSAVS